jgi:hypothetical protein
MVSRREVLRLGAVAALSLPVVAACTTPEAPPPPDPLAALAATARADAAAATAVASGNPALASVASEIANARTEHAAALQAEVDRERPPASSSAPPPSDPAPAADPVNALSTALTAAEQEAAALVESLPRYRAGLVGSVAAGCAALREVLA